MCKIFPCTVRNFTLIYPLNIILKCISLLLKSDEISEGTDYKLLELTHWKTDITKPTVKTRIPSETHLIGKKSITWYKNKVFKM